MVKWYDRIGNSIEMKLFSDADSSEFEWVRGRVISGYRYQDGIVSMASENERVIWCGVESGCYRKTEDSLGDLITQADRIRSMSDEELAEFINKKTACDCCSAKHCQSDERCMVDILEWLKSEAKE